MKMKFVLNLLMTSAVCLIFSSAASAQATRTWVSGVGDDVNPCSRTAPCKTFAGAISKTAANGEINALDPAGFGAVTVTKGITIDGSAGPNRAGLLVASGSGVIVNAGANDRVILRNLEINGLSPNASAGSNGIRFLAGKTLVVENCVIFGFTTHGIDVNVPGQSELIVKDTEITGCGGAGIKTVTALTPVNSRIDNCRIEKCGQGVFIANGSRSVISRSAITMCSVGVLTESVGSNAEVAVVGCVVSFCSTAGIQAGNGAGQTAVTRISGTTIAHNTTGISINGGTVSSTGDNFIYGNNTPGAPNGPGIGPS
jgi:Right handed beta helix region